MATYKSDEVTARDASAGAKFLARTNSAEVKLAKFTFNTPTGTAQDETVELANLPTGAEVIGFASTNEAMGTSATATLAIDGTTIASAVDVAAAGSDFTFVAPIASTAGDVTLTMAGADWTADKDFNGVILYIVNA